MSDAGTLKESREDAVRIAMHLTRTRGLAEADVISALQLQRAENIPFATALYRLGLAAPEDVDAALNPDGRVSTPAQVPPAGQPVSGRVGIRALRTELLLRQASEPHNCLALVAAQAGDGVSALAAELAVAFAQLGEPTLLIDSDLRQPQQHQLFRLGFRTGLADLLIDPRTSIAYAGVAGLPQLTVLSAGQRPGNPQELLSSVAFTQFLERARAQFRHVIIDTADASNSSDALIVASAAGSALTVARIDATPMPAFNGLIRALRSASVRIVGGVVNAASPAR